MIEKVNAEYNSGERILPSEAARRAAEEAATASAPIAEVKPVLSIEDIKRKSEVLSRLSVKWDSLAEKRRRVENFAISHDGDTASAIIRDAQGEVFESNSPKTIGQLIEFWKAEFSEAIANVEKEMREIAWEIQEPRTKSQEKKAKGKKAKIQDKKNRSQLELWAVQIKFIKFNFH